MPTLSELTNANVRRQVEWDQKSQIDLSYRGNEMAGEMGEALEKAFNLIEMAIATGRASNILKKRHRELLGIIGSRATKQQLGMELGDVIICASLTAAAEDINLDEFVTRAFNAKTDQFGFKTRLGPPPVDLETTNKDIEDHKWIGVDFDGTLVAYDGWKRWNQFGPVLQPMLNRIQHWLAEGQDVRIFTARVCFDIDFCRLTGEEITRAQMVSAIQDWCEANGLPRLPVTNVKDIYMKEIWDDRAVQMVPNTGRTLADEHEAERSAEAGKGFPS